MNFLRQEPAKADSGESLLAVRRTVLSGEERVPEGNSTPMAVKIAKTEEAKKDCASYHAAVLNSERGDGVLQPPAFAGDGPSSS